MCIAKREAEEPGSETEADDRGFCALDEIIVWFRAGH